MTDPNASATPVHEPRIPSFRRPERESGRRASTVAAALVVSVLGACAPAGEGNPPTVERTVAGFAAASQDAQLACEDRFLTLPSSDGFREHLRTITAEPHPTGSEAQVRVGEYIADAMRISGWDVEAHGYDVYLPQLTDDVEAHIVTPVAMQLTNREPALEEDRFSTHEGLLNGWNAFSGSGDVTGQVVYANQGRREDYRALDSLGISLEGRVVIARYGGNFRGYKVKFAEERGAAGVIMFNDPGNAEGEAYPEGPMMTPWTIQRGSVLTLPWTGDPLTPFYAAVPLDEDPDLERLDPSEVDLHTIPVLPIGYGSAVEILNRMTGRSGARRVAGWNRGRLSPHRRGRTDRPGSRESAQGPDESHQHRRHVARLRVSR